MIVALVALLVAAAGSIAVAEAKAPKPTPALVRSTRARIRRHD